MITENKLKLGYCIFERKTDGRSKMENRDVILENTKKLVCNNGFDKVTVKMICEKTNISRKTFYTFYQDKYDILEQILIKDVLNEFSDLIDKFGKMELNRPIILEQMFQNIYANKEFYSKVINIKGENSLESYLLYYFIKLYYKILADVKVDSAVEMDYLTYFYSSSCVMLIKKWILDGYVLTPKQMAEYYQNWAVSALANNYFYCK